MTPNPYKRHRTRTAGVYFRVKADGTKTYQVHAGGGKFVSCSTEKEAKLVQADLRTKKGRGEKVVVNDRTTFAQLSEEWYTLKAKRLRKRTETYYRTTLDDVLLPRFGSWRVSAIDAEAISGFIAELESEGLHAVDRSKPRRPLGRSSIDNYLKPMQGTLKLAARRKLIPENPFTHLTEDDRPKAESKQVHEWTQDELDALLRASETISARPESRYDYTPLLRLTARLGLRIGEVLGLQWQDFDKDAGTLRVERQWTRFGEYGPTKTKAGERTMFLPDDLRDELNAMRLRGGFSTHPIFSSLNGTPLMHRNVTKRGWEPVRELAGLEGVSFHELRHAAFSRLHSKRLSDKMIADQLGHGDVNTMHKVYVHVYEREENAQAVREAFAQ